MTAADGATWTAVLLAAATLWQTVRTVRAVRRIGPVARAMARRRI